MVGVQTGKRENCSKRRGEPERGKKRVYQLRIGELPWPVWLSWLECHPIN